jgi:hypothetical protein
MTGWDVLGNTMNKFFSRSGGYGGAYDGYHLYHRV